MFHRRKKVKLSWRRKNNRHISFSVGAYKPKHTQLEILSKDMCLEMNEASLKDLKVRQNFFNEVKLLLESRLLNFISPQNASLYIAMASVETTTTKKWLALEARILEIENS